MSRSSPSRRPDMIGEDPSAASPEVTRRCARIGSRRREGGRGTPRARRAPRPRARARPRPGRSGVQRVHVQAQRVRGRSCTGGRARGCPRASRSGARRYEWSRCRPPGRPRPAGRRRRRARVRGSAGRCGGPPSLVALLARPVGAVDVADVRGVVGRLDPAHLVLDRTRAPRARRSRPAGRARRCPCSRSLRAETSETVTCETSWPARLSSRADPAVEVALVGLEGS